MSLTGRRPQGHLPPNDLKFTVVQGTGAYAGDIGKGVLHLVLNPKAKTFTLKFGR